jgi:hypothetical protein
MAECPTCNKNWKWDWCGDGLRDNEGKYAKVIKKLIDNDEHLYIERCNCGKIIAITTEEDYGSDVLYAGDWGGINWEQESYNPC